MDEETEAKPTRKRKLREPTPHWLRQRALSYLDRFPATTMKLRQHLFSKARAAMEEYGISAADLRASIDEEIAKLVKSRILNDAEFAASKARILARQGKSTNYIRNKLLQLEFTEDQAEDAMSELAGSTEERDLQAAARYVRKRKFGPYKPEDSRSERYQKEMASLARNGFSYDIARKILALESPEDVEDMIAGNSG